MAQYNKNTNAFLSDGKTLFETVMIADQYGNLVGPANPSGMAADAFGRARTSQPLTLFDSFHRYQENGKFSTSTSGTASTSHDTNSSSVLLNIGTASGDQVIRESNRVFAYQPGKSLQIFTTFAMSAPKTNLRQRVGYFTTDNGIYLQQNNSTISLVLRSYSTGSITENIVAKSSWNMDKLDGTGPSGKTLDLTKAHIFFMDIEWLGVGSVRCGFVIDGKLIHCHSFHHANVVTSTYMTTAMLPIRCEITNTGTTESSSSYREVCSTVISEGGYELRGRPRSVSMPVGSPRDLPTGGTFVPVMSLRLKSTRLNAIVVPKNLNLLGIGNNTRMIWKIVNNPTLTGASWQSAGVDSYVEYDLSAISYTGGTDLVSGIVNVTNQSAQVSSLDTGTFKYQLERNAFTSTPFSFTIAVAGFTNGDDILGSLDWEEI